MNHVFTLVIVCLGILNSAYSSPSGLPDIRRSVFLMSRLISSENPGIDYLKSLPEPNNIDEWHAAMRDAFEKITWDSERDMPNEKFSNWLIGYHAEVFRTRLSRNIGIENGWWNVPLSPELLRLNAEYLDRFPERINLGDHFGGAALDVPPSSLDQPNDLAYYLMELEPLIFSSLVSAYEIDYREIVTSNKSVTSKSLNDFASSILERAYALPNPNDYDTESIKHWTGNWKLYRRRYPGESKDYHAGILTMEAYLDTYPRARNWVNEGIYRNLLCKPLTEAKSIPPSIIPFMKKNDPNPGKKEECSKCHYVIDSLSNVRFEVLRNIDEINVNYYFSHYTNLLDFDSENGRDRFNNINGTTFNTYPFMGYYYSYSYDKYLPVHSIKDVGQRVAGDPLFAKCVVSNLFKKIYNRSVGIDDMTIIESLTSSFEDDQFNFKELLFNVIIGSIKDGAN